MARFRVCDAVDRGGDALHLVLLRVLVPDERVMGMFRLSDVLWVVVVVDVDVDSWFDGVRTVSRCGSDACGI
jgi:hypothetical protein